MDVCVTLLSSARIIFPQYTFQPRPRLCLFYKITYQRNNSADTGTADIALFQLTHDELVEFSNHTAFSLPAMNDLSWNPAAVISIQGTPVSLQTVSNTYCIHYGVDGFPEFPQQKLSANEKVESVFKVKVPVIH